jgi:hypothetical protein
VRAHAPKHIRPKARLLGQRPGRHIELVEVVSVAWHVLQAQMTRTRLAANEALFCTSA